MHEPFAHYTPPAPAPRPPASPDPLLTTLPLQSPRDTMLHLASAVLLAGGAHAAATATRHLHQDIGSMEGTLTAETAEFNAPTPAECTSVMAGCTGTFANGAAHNVGGMLTVIDDCTFRVTSWTFDGTGPAVEWWAEQGEGDPEMFPYDPATSLKIAEIGEPGNYVAGAPACTNARPRAACTIAHPAQSHAPRSSSGTASWSRLQPCASLLMADLCLSGAAVRRLGRWRLGRHHRAPRQGRLWPAAAAQPRAQPHLALVRGVHGRLWQRAALLRERGCALARTCGRARTRARHGAIAGGC